jgi:hypothetical protein
MLNTHGAENISQLLNMMNTSAEIFPLGEINPILDLENITSFLLCHVLTILQRLKVSEKIFQICVITAARNISNLNEVVILIFLIHKRYFFVNIHFLLSSFYSSSKYEQGSKLVNSIGKTLNKNDSLVVV